MWIPCVMHDKVLIKLRKKLYLCRIFIRYSRRVFAFRLLPKNQENRGLVTKEKKVLVTGASGFIGYYLVHYLKSAGYEVYAGVRSGSDTRELHQMGARLVVLDMNRTDALRGDLRQWRGEIGRWDYIIHTAGVTKCYDKNDFDRVNNLNTRRFLDLLREEGMIPAKFVFLSSLSVYGPIHEYDAQPISGGDTPRPNTVYGWSKLRAEEYLCAQKDMPYIILRPTGVYGPREKDYFMMVQSVQKHFDLSVGYRPQVLTFIYVADVAQAVLRSMESEVVNRAYFLSDGQEYSTCDFSELIQKELEVKQVFRITLPLWMLKMVSFLSQTIAALLKRSSTLNLDKYKIMKQRNWRCDIQPARADLGYAPQYTLSRGVKETINWYKKEEWL